MVGINKITSSVQKFTLKNQSYKERVQCTYFNPSWADFSRVCLMMGGWVSDFSPGQFDKSLPNWVISLSLFSFSHFFFFFESGDQLVPTSSTLSARIIPKWLSKLRWLWISLPWPIACKLVSPIGSHTIPGQHNQPTLTSPGQGCKRVMFKCNLPPALLAEWPGSFMWQSCNSGMEQTLNKSQQRKLILRRKFSHCSC